VTRTMIKAIIKKTREELDGDTGGADNKETTYNEGKGSDKGSVFLKKAKFNGGKSKKAS